MDDGRGGLATTDEIVKGLENEFPLFQIWTVHRYIGGTHWCARLWSDHKVIFNADSPGELRSDLREYVPGE